MKYVAAGVIVLVLCSCAWAEEESANAFLHSLTWQANASLPMTYKNGDPSRELWNEGFSFGAGVEAPFGNHLAYQLHGDYYRFIFLPTRGTYIGRIGIKPDGASWLWDVMINMKWHFTKPSSSVRPFIALGMGWTWGRLFFFRDGCYGWNSGYTHYSVGIGQFGIGATCNVSQRISVFAEADAEQRVDLFFLENTYSGNTVDFFPIKIGFSFR
jgi:hypothetical protein